MKLDTSLENTIQINGGRIPRGVVNFGMQKMALSMWIKCKMKLSRRVRTIENGAPILIDLRITAFRQSRMRRASR